MKNETVGNISHLPEELVELVRAGLRGEPVGVVGGGFEIERSLPAGHVAAALAMARRLELTRLLNRTSSRERDLCLAMICQRAIAPASKLATARAFDQSTLASALGVEGIDEDDLYGALDWLGARQERIEDRLARRHLKDGELVLYDVSSSYFEGRCCPLARLGYSRDGRRGTPQIIYGLLCDKPGRPVAVEVFSGELHDDKTLPSQVAKLKQRFGLETVVVVSDRGMVTRANLSVLAETDGVGWITALKAPQIKKLVTQGALQLSLFDQHSLAEITAAEDYPGERLASAATRSPRSSAPANAKSSSQPPSGVCRRSQSASPGARFAGPPRSASRSAQPPSATGCANIRTRNHRRQLRLPTQDRPDRGRSRPRRHLRTAHQHRRLQALHRRGRALLQTPRAGRTSLKTLKGPELEIRPIHHRLEDRVRSHVFLCMLAYYLTWHLRKGSAPLLFKDEQPPTQPDPVAKAHRSTAAQQKAQTKHTPTGERCHSYKSLLAELATLTRNTIRLPGANATFDKLAQPTQLQAHALDLAQHAPVIA